MTMKHLTLLLLLFGLTISVYGQTPRTESEAIKLIDSLYLKLMNGADFATLATQYSEDHGTEGKSGVYSNMKIGTFVPEFESVVLKLKLNEISKPFKTQFGYHIAQILERNGDTFTVRHLIITFKE
jgi:peptidyl-prolyl cis-trans isomerase SurA